MTIHGKRPEIRTLTKCALCAALLCAASYLVLPLPFTPVVITLHTVAVNLIGLILPPGAAGLTVLTYLLMGFVGLPVFAGGTAGPGKLFGPTGGFYFGFLFGAVIISLLRGRKRQLWRYILVTVFAGIPIQHFFGVLFFCFYNGFQVRQAVLTVSAPFLAGDMGKAVLASLIAAVLNKARKEP